MRTPSIFAFCLALSLITVSLAFGQDSVPAAATQQLYLLAGTPAQDYGYPVTLYRPDVGKLKVVREVLSPYEGLRWVRAGQSVIFLLHTVREDDPPNSPARAVAIIHTDEPSRADDIVFTPQCNVSVDYSAGIIDGDEPSRPDDIPAKVCPSVDYYHIALAEPRASVIDELLPLNDGIHGDNTLAIVSGDATAAGPKLRLNVGTNTPSYE